MFFLFFSIDILQRKLQMRRQRLSMAGIRTSSPPLPDQNSFLQSKLEEEIVPPRNVEGQQVRIIHFETN